MKKKNSQPSKNNSRARQTRSIRRKPGEERISVLGVDPGTLVTGYGLVSRSGDRLLLITSGAIRNKPSDSLSQRLRHIYDELEKVIRSHHPDEFAIETAFYGKNAQSALKLGHARGVSLLAAAHQKIPATEYTPREIKKAVTGNGQASKEQIKFMVKTMLAIQGARMVSDISDAIAAAICHLHRLTAKGKSHKSWESFVQDHPERVIL